MTTREKNGANNNERGKYKKNYKKRQKKEMRVKGKVKKLRRLRGEKKCLQETSATDIRRKISEEVVNIFIIDVLKTNHIE